jgi:hypothetical protein
MSVSMVQPRKRQQVDQKDERIVTKSVAPEPGGPSIIQNSSPPVSILSQLNPLQTPSQSP